MKIPIHRLPYWVLSHNLEDQKINKVCQLRKQFSSNGEILIGSFQKDGNGNSGETPKISKGAVLLVRLLTELSSLIKIKVVLGGYARQYVINKLEERNIPYVYLQKYDDINSLYDCLDWYFITSRYEGGPQSVLEASYRKIKILSTDVGVAPEILHPDCICNDTDDFIKKVQEGLDRRDYNYNMIINNHLPANVIPKWDDFFENQRKKIKK
jgi:glycosyltransferase involved in cell wall biosynthesis